MANIRKDLAARKPGTFQRKVPFLPSCQLEDIFILGSHLINSLAEYNIHVQKLSAFRILKTLCCFFSKCPALLG